MRPPLDTFWHALERLAGGEGVLADWRRMLPGHEPALGAWLRPLGRVATAVPCPEQRPCGCRHEVRAFDGLQMSVCRCGPDGCEPSEVSAEDLILHGLDVARLGERLGPIIGFAPVEPRLDSSSGPMQIGLYPPLQAPVYLLLPQNGATLARLTQSAGQAGDGPSILLVPSRIFLTATVRGIMNAAGALALSLADTVAMDIAGKLTAKFSTRPLLEDWTARLGANREPAQLLRSLHAQIVAARSDLGQARQARQRLEALQGQGLLGFTRKVDPKSFRVLCAVLAEGDVAKAARSLGMPDSTLREFLRSWRRRGATFATMLDLIRWRKTMGRRGNVPLNENILLGRAESVDYPGLLSDVLDGLLAMTDENWRAHCDALKELLSQER